MGRDPREPPRLTPQRTGQQSPPARRGRAPGPEESRKQHLRRLARRVRLRERTPALYPGPDGPGPEGAGREPGDRNGPGPDPEKPQPEERKRRAGAQIQRGPVPPARAGAGEGPGPGPLAGTEGQKISRSEIRGWGEPETALPPSVPRRVGQCLSSRSVRPRLQERKPGPVPEERALPAPQIPGQKGSRQPGPAAKNRLPGQEEAFSPRLQEREPGAVPEDRALPAPQTPGRQGSGQPGPAAKSGFPGQEEALFPRRKCLEPGGQAVREQTAGTGETEKRAPSSGEGPGSLPAPGAAAPEEREKPLSFAERGTPSGGKPRLRFASASRTLLTRAGTAVAGAVNPPEDRDNPGTDSAHGLRTLGEGAAAIGRRQQRRRLRNRPAQAAGRPEAGKPLSRSRWYQRKDIRRGYAARRAASAPVPDRKGGSRTVRRTASPVTRFLRDHGGPVLAAAALVLLGFLFFGNVFTACSVLVDSAAGSLAASTYPSSDEDMLAAEASYLAREAQLQEYLDTYESTHDYDQVRYDLDEIGHDPYVLISFLTAWHGGAWTLQEVQGTLDRLFARQYILTEEESQGAGSGRTGKRVSTVCTVTLENTDLSHLPVYTMSEEQLQLYALYMSCLGNRPDLFPDSGYVDRYAQQEPGYVIPPEAMEDGVFARMMEEAQKYIGYPYVWGGSSPATSFDCSGYVSWVINHSGWNYGRLGATALYSIGTPVPAAEARPGDLVFFQGTYDTDGMSHCGIYVGGGMMLHCGDPIGYANLNSSYWQAHLAGFCRLPRPTN